MIATILPGAVASAASTTDPEGVFLFPEEAALVSRSVEKRRREFTTVRHCARRALAQLGVPPQPILHGRRGAPRWPAGVVGAMTHCAGYRAAAVAWRADVEAIGIDAEPHAPLPAGVLEQIALPAERARLAELAARLPGVHWDRLLFSTKESVYKAWFPMTAQELGFKDAVITPHANGRFSARLLLTGTGPGPHRFEGRWAISGGLVLTAVTYRTSVKPP